MLNVCGGGGGAVNANAPTICFRNDTGLLQHQRRYVHTFCTYTHPDGNRKGMNRQFTSIGWCVCVYVCARALLYMSMYLCVSLCVCVWRCVYTHMLCMRARVCVCVCVCVCVDCPQSGYIDEVLYE